MKTLKFYKKELQLIKELAKNYIDDSITSDGFASDTFVVDKDSLANFLAEIEHNKMPISLIDKFLDCLVYKPVSFNDTEKDRLFSNVVYKIGEFVEGRSE